MERGYVRLWRKTLDSEVMGNAYLCQLWMWCLVRANYKPAKFHGLTLKPGQFVTSTITGSLALNMSRSYFHRCLHRLEELGMVKVQAGLKNTVVTIVKWADYQSDSVVRASDVATDNNICETQRGHSKHCPPADNNLLPDDLLKRTEDAQRTHCETDKNKRMKEEENKDSPASPGEAAEQKPKKPRPRNLLFDAIVELSHADPVVNGGQIGALAALLAKAKPPYTPEEVLRLPDAIRVSGLPAFKLTVSAIKSHIALVRQFPAATPEESTEAKIARLAAKLKEKRHE